MTLLRSFALGVCSMLLGACGATHHFVPSQPLPKGEWRFSAVLHYDLNRASVPTLIPDCNLYGGLGKDYSLGIGLQFPFFLTHLSTIKHFAAESYDRWAAYLHVNNLLAGNANPQFETGATYYAIAPDLWQSFSGGVGFGYRPHGEDYITDFRLGRYLFGDSPGLIPTFKYAISGRHVALSYIHHFGMTRTMLSPLLPGPDPAEGIQEVSVYRDSIATIIVAENRYNWGSDSIVVILKSGDTLTLVEPPVFRGCGGVGIPPPPPPKEAWLASHGISNNIAVHRNGRWLFGTNGHLLDIHKEIRQRGQVRLNSSTLKLATALKGTSTWKADHSFGVVYTDRIRN